MRIILGSDHRGFQKKEFLKDWLFDHHFEVIDVGALTYDPDDDYVDFALKAVDPAIMQSSDLTILLCGSGHGMDMVANRFSHVRAILGFNFDVVRQGRLHENANVLILPADWISESQLIEYVDTFINTKFSGDDRHLRRLHKLAQLTQ